MRIFLLRHGESLGQVDQSAYARLQDHNVPLTALGKKQAEMAGRFLAEYHTPWPGLENKKFRIWHSPFVRTSETCDAFAKGFGANRVESVREDYLLREQDFGIFSDMPDEKDQKTHFPHEFAKFAKNRSQNGRFYARAPLGESRADVAQRVRVFMETLMRDAKNGQEDVIIIGHGVTNRAFEMNFLHKTVDWFEKSVNPANCEIRLIEGDRDGGYAASTIYTPPAITTPRPTPAKPTGPSS